MSNPYVKTIWRDHIVDNISGDIIQEGTRFTATRANNIENGIYNVYDYVLDLESIVKRLQAQLEIDGRVPGNSGAFFDTFDGKPSRLTLLTTSTSITSDIIVGATTIPVSDTTGFKPFTFITVFDGQNTEDVLVTAVGTNQLTVTALVNGYSKGANVSYSNVILDIINQEMEIGQLSTYSVSVSEVV